MLADKNLNPQVVLTTSDKKKTRFKLQRYLETSVAAS